MDRRKFLKVFGLGAAAALAVPAVLLKQEPVPKWRRAGSTLEMKGKWKTYEPTMQHFARGNGTYTVPKSGYYRVTMIGAGGGGQGGSGVVHVVKFYGPGEQVELTDKDIIHRL